MTLLKPCSGGYALYDNHELIAWWPTCASVSDAVSFQIAYLAKVVKPHE